MSFYDRRTHRYEVPTENCIYRVLKAVPVEPFQRAVWAWQKVRLGAADGDVVVLDGKAVRGSQGTQLVGAINAHSGRTLGVQAVADKSNEIPAAQTLLQRLELDGMIALLDALHTQVETARAIVLDRGGGFVLVVKGNQPTLLARAKNLLREDFSPSGVAGRTRPRARRMARHRGQGGHPGTDGVSTCGAVGAG